MSSDQYTSYAFDEETDLGRIPYWIYSLLWTPPGLPRTPMFDWLFMNGTNLGSSYAYDRLSLPSAKALAFRSYNGYQFVTVVLPETAEEINERTVKFTEEIRHLIENVDRLWAEAKIRLLGYTQKPKTFDFDKAGWFEMARLFQERMEAEREMYEIVHYFSKGLGVIYDNFERICSDMMGIDESDPLFQKLMSGFDNDSYQVDRGLYILAKRAGELGVQAILLNPAGEEVISKMEEIEGGRQWVQELRDFLRIHGWRCPVRMGSLSPSWVEEPALAIRHLQQYARKSGALGLDEMLKEQTRERVEAEQTLVARAPEAQREWFKVFMKAAQTCVVWNTEHPYYCQMAQYAVTRYVLLGIGKRLCQAGCLERPEDTLFLIPEDMIKALTSPEATDLKPVVAKRREVWEKNKNIIPPPLIARISPEEVAKKVIKSGDPLATKMIIGKSLSAAGKEKGHFVGDASSPGIGEGTARVILSSDQLGEIAEGDILVAPAIWPNWSPVFPLLKGIITDREGTLSSRSTFVAREYGIPVVTNVIDGTSRIKSGQRLRVDGSLGTVQIVESLYGKKILAVDDEPDILEVLEDLLPMCQVVKVGTFQEAKRLLETEPFDIAILDIMGVDGYTLLEIAMERDVVAVMLTARALSLEDTVASYKKGAAFYIPKEEMAGIETFLNDVLEGRQQGRHFWWRWYDRFGSLYEKKFGPDWQNKYPEFWEMFGHGELKS